jgi:lupus La protein
MTTISETTSTSPDLDQKIIRQIEYYFSDVNMVRDKFLKNEGIKDDGWIPLSILTTFKRLQSLTTDFKTIMNALKKSLSGLLELNETEHKIRRHPNRQLPNSQAELELSLRNRTVYVKGFPTTEDVTLDKLLQFFEKYGSTDNIQMRKQFKSKDFNGSVFVVFPTDEKTREFIENSKQTPIKYDDKSILECSLQDDYYKTDSSTDGKDKQTKKEKKQDELEKRTNEHLEKLNSGNLTGALIHLAGEIFSEG